MTSSFTLATANTHFGRTLYTPNGLGAVKSADILLLQEVFTLPTRELKTILTHYGFVLLHTVPAFGLVIAMRKTSYLQPLPHSLREHRLGKITRPEQFIVKRATRSPLVFTERGVITCQFSTVNNQIITVANVHPTTPIAATPRARHRQIKRLARVVAHFYPHSPLIVGGDMNHYPRPRKVDLAFHKVTSLTPIQLGSTPTWYARGSKEEKVLALAAKVLRRPLEDFNGQHDIILYRKMHFTPLRAKVVDIPSDHRAIIATFELK
jgi:endonuclease/exonuclease/phosphatase (EEP) superfamily protein YafD